MLCDHVKTKLANCFEETPTEQRLEWAHLSEDSRDALQRMRSLCDEMKVSWEKVHLSQLQDGCPKSWTSQAANSG